MKFYKINLATLIILALSTNIATADDGQPCDPAMPLQEHISCDATTEYNKSVGDALRPIALDNAKNIGNIAGTLDDITDNLLTGKIKVRNAEIATARISNGIIGSAQFSPTGNIHINGLQTEDDGEYEVKTQFNVNKMHTNFNGGMDGGFTSQGDYANIIARDIPTNGTPPQALEEGTGMFVRKDFLTLQSISKSAGQKTDITLRDDLLTLGLTDAEGNTYGMAVTDSATELTGGTTTMLLEDNGVTLSSADGALVQIHNVENGTAANDATNLSQLQEVDGRLSEETSKNATDITDLNASTGTGELNVKKARIGAEGLKVLALNNGNVHLQSSSSQGSGNIGTFILDQDESTWAVKKDRVGSMVTMTAKSLSVVLENENGAVTGLSIEEESTSLTGGTAAMSLGDDGVTFAQSSGSGPDKAVQLHGIADGTADNDAVNYSQLQAATDARASENTALNGRIDGHDTDIGEWKDVPNPEFGKETFPRDGWAAEIDNPTFGEQIDNPEFDDSIPPHSETNPEKILDERLTITNPDSQFVEDTRTTIPREEPIRLAIENNEDDIKTNGELIGKERQDRSNADVAMQGHIQANTDDITSLQEEDTVLHGRIDGIVAGGEANAVLIDAETTERKAEDTAINQRAVTETTERKAGDAALDGRINEHDADIGEWKKPRTTTLRGAIENSEGLIQRNTTRITTNEGNIAANSSRIQSLDSKLSGGIAAVTALGMIPGITASDHRFSLGMGYGNFEGESAVALGLTGRVTNSITIKAGAGFNNDTYAVGAGAGYSW